MDKQVIEFDVIKKKIDETSILNEAIKEIEKILDVDTMIILVFFKDNNTRTTTIGLSHQYIVNTIYSCLMDIEKNRYKNQKKISDPFPDNPEITNKMEKIKKDLRINLDAKGVIIVTVNTQKNFYISCSSGLSRREKILLFINALIDINDNLPNN